MPDRSNGKTSSFKFSLNPLELRNKACAIPKQYYVGQTQRLRRSVYAKPKKASVYFKRQYEHEKVHQPAGPIYSLAALRERQGLLNLVSSP